MAKPFFEIRGRLFGTLSFFPIPVKEKTQRKSSLQNLFPSLSV